MATYFNELSAQAIIILNNRAYEAIRYTPGMKDSIAWETAWKAIDAGKIADYTTSNIELDDLIMQNAGTYTDIFEEARKSPHAARIAAITWQRMVSELNLSYSELVAFYELFTECVKLWPELADEFHENAIC